MRGDPQSAPRSAHRTIQSDPIAVRLGLKSLLEDDLLRSLPDDGKGTAELVLAETLNNIVEHAYMDMTGEIEVSLTQCATGLICKIVDSGHPMPNGCLPVGALPDHDPEVAEGGFGWFLIRTLSADLAYARVNGENHLSFRLELEQ